MGSAARKPKLGIQEPRIFWGSVTFGTEWPAEASIDSFRKTMANRIFACLLAFSRLAPLSVAESETTPVTAGATHSRVR